MKHFTEIIYFGQIHAGFKYDDYLTARKIKRLWLKLQRLMIAEVNGEVTPENYLKKEQKLRATIKALVFGTRFIVETHSDPRRRVVVLYYQQSQFNFDWI